MDKCDGLVAFSDYLWGSVELVGKTEQETQGMESKRRKCMRQRETSDIITIEGMVSTVASLEYSIFRLLVRDC